MVTESPRKPRFVPNSQQYLFDNYGIPPVSDRRERDWIKQGIFPEKVPLSPGRKANTDAQLDEYAQRLLAQAS
jgi:hypothetical protein